MKYDCVIIGAGMSGLAAGIRLAHYGKKVVILEKHAIPGGLNSYYSKEGRRFDVGLHAMTNFVPRGERGAPLTKLLRQLRIRYDELDLVEQSHSLIDFPENRLKFGNGYTLIEEEVAREFPSEVDGFVRLVEHVKTYDDVSLDAVYVSARSVVESFIKSPVLQDMIFCPVMYYGSAVEDDMDFSQFCIMFKSLYLEGFCRPQTGVRHLLRLLRRKYLDNGGEIRMRSGVKQIRHGKGLAEGVELESGEFLEAKQILSSAGYCETLDLMDLPTPPEAVGQLSFVESILMMDEKPAKLGLDETIIFFNREESFSYKKPREAYSCASGVICLPGNFQYADKEPEEGMVRFTSLADYEKWKGFTPEEYLAVKKDVIR